MENTRIKPTGRKKIIPKNENTISKSRFIFSLLQKTLNLNHFLQRDRKILTDSKKMRKMPLLPSD